MYVFPPQTRCKVILSNAKIYGGTPYSFHLYNNNNNNLYCHVNNNININNINAGLTNPPPHCHRNKKLIKTLILY